MLIEDGYAHSLKALLEKDHTHRARKRNPRVSDFVLPPWGVVVATIIALFCLTVFLVSLGMIYVGDEYVQPAFSEQSVPPPRSY